MGSSIEGMQPSEFMKFVKEKNQWICKQPSIEPSCGKQSM
jgi:hypothetical protein